jgi:hypothetical protein
MGVTIHFEGQLKSEQDFDKVNAKAIDFAKINGYEYFLINETYKRLDRVQNELDWDYEGPTKGVQIQIDQSIDPFILEFDKDLYIQEYCKTQFADIDVHLTIINFLRDIEKYFQRLMVNDEGEYWETNDIRILQEHIDNCNRVMEEQKTKNPKMNGPYRMSNGRIFDLLTDD